MPTPGRPTSRSRLSTARSLFWRLPALLAVAFLILPLLAIFLNVLPQSHLWHTLREPFVTQALRTSLITSLSSLVLTVMFGTPLAYALARRRGPGTTLFDTLLDLPMVLPPTVAGVALLMTFGRRGLLGPWLDAMGIQVVFTMAAVVLARALSACRCTSAPPKPGFAVSTRNWSASPTPSDTPLPERSSASLYPWRFRAC